MSISRRAPISKRNDKLLTLEPKRNEKNKAWLARSGIEDGILLLGASNLEGFRIRVAQSVARSDLLPSFWSHVGILRGGTVDTVTLDPSGDLSAVPANNGVGAHRLTEFDNPKRFPNIAAIRFTDKTATIRKCTRHVRADRQTVDIPSLIVTWLAYVWGARGQGNPLAEGYSVPSAALVSRVYAIAGIELTPGLTSEASSPEAIWQAAIWWHRYYEEASKDSPSGDAAVLTPSGRCAIRQEEACVWD
jgi:hypothetical protein